MLPRSIMRSTGALTKNSSAAASASASRALSSAAASSLLMDPYIVAKFSSASTINMDTGSSRNYSRNFSELNVGSSLKYEQGTSYHYNSNIERFTSAKDWKSVFSIMNQMAEAGLEPNLWKIAHALKDGCADEAVWTQFVNGVSEVRSLGLLQKNVEAFSFAMSTCSRNGWSNLVIKLYEEMKHAEMLEQWAYLEVLSAYRLENNSNAAKTTLHEMLKLYRLSDGDYCDVYRLTMETCIENDRWDEALKLFQEMDQAEGRRDIGCFRLALQACAMLKEPELALKFQNEIHVSSLIPDDVCYKYVILTCADSGLSKEAGSYFIEFASKRFSKAPKGSWICSTSDTTWECFEIAFESCITARDTELAEKVVDSMYAVLESGGKQSPQSPKPQVEKSRISDADLNRLRSSVQKFSEPLKFDIELFIKSKI